MPEKNERVGGFDSVKHLLKVVVKTQAAIVKRTFRDIDDDDLSIANLIQESNKNTDGKGPPPKISEMSMKLACTPTEDDSLSTIILKLFLYYFIFRRMRDLYPEIYGMPNLNFHENLKFLPQVLLYFSEDKEDVDPDYAPIDAQITFRITGEVTQGTVDQIARQIFQIFTNNGKGPLYRWKKGQKKLVYRDNKTGCNFQINAFDFADGIKIVKDVLSIRNIAFEPLNLTKSELEGTHPPIPGELTVLGKRVKKPRRRPTGIVHFRYAELHIHGLPNPIVLVDTTHKKRGAMYRTDFGVR